MSLDLLYDPMFWAGVCGSLALILLVLAVPADPGVDHHDDDDHGSGTAPPPVFPMF
jgi:hypothetical protein